MEIWGHMKRHYSLLVKKENIKQGLYMALFAFIMYFCITLLIKNIVVFISLFVDSSGVLAIFERLKQASVSVPWLVVIGYGICSGLLLRVKRFWVILLQILVFLIAITLGIYLSRVNDIPVYGFLHIIKNWIENGIFDLLA